MYIYSINLEASCPATGTAPVGEFQFGHPELKSQVEFIREVQSVLQSFSDVEESRDWFDNIADSLVPEMKKRGYTYIEPREISASAHIVVDSSYKENIDSLTSQAEWVERWY